MEGKAVVKKKIISASKLQPVKLKQSFSHIGQSQLTSLENDFASINISQNPQKEQVKNSDITITNRRFSSDIGLNGKDSPTPRFNPFDRSDDSSRSSLSSNTSQSMQTVDSPDAGLAELGLAEDHFSGSLGLSSVEELKVAIESCKEMILKVPENSKKWKKFTENLVGLRIKLQDIKDSPDYASPNLKLVLGHKLKKHKSRNFKAICDCCRSSLWSLIPVWYECKECSFICHEKCIDSIRRSCVAKLAKTASFVLKICPEAGLSKQMYCCMECKNPITVGPGSDKGHLCDYTGYYYCSNCHWDDAMTMPGRVVHNWDHSPQKVCRQSYQLLLKMYRLPILNIEKINPMLFNYVEELSEIKRMRENIIKMKQYLLTCTAALELKLLRQLSNRQHFIDNSNMYSMDDLIQTNSGQLTEELVKVHSIFAKHIKIDCLACQGKGFICEICNSGEALFPFDYMVSICPKCSAVFHSDCFSFIDKTCPRCRRKQEKRNVSLSYIFGGEKLSSSDEEEEEKTNFPNTFSPGPLSQSPFTSWLATHDKRTTNDARPAVVSLRSDSPVHSDRTRAIDTYSASRADRAYVMSGECVDEPSSEPTNPFMTEQDDDIPDTNPFSNDVYDQSKNPFCCS